MKQKDLDLGLAARLTCEAVCLREMEQVVPWAEFLALVQPHVPQAKTDRPPFALEATLRIHLVPLWFTFSDVAMEETLWDVPLYREFAGFTGMTCIPDRVNLLRFRHLPERHGLAQRILQTATAVVTERRLLLKECIVADFPPIAAPSSTTNKSGKRDPQMRQTKKDGQQHFGMKVYIGADANSGPVHTVVGTAVNANDVTQVYAVVHDEERDVLADGRYQRAATHKDTQHIRVRWHVALRLDERRALNKTIKRGRLTDELERVKAAIDSKVEHPFQVLKRQFDYRKMRYRGLAKNTAQITTLVCTGQPEVIRKRLIALQA